MRVLAKCGSCERKIELLIENDEDWKIIDQLNLGELFEHQCPACDIRAIFEKQSHRWHGT